LKVNFGGYMQIAPLNFKSFNKLGVFQFLAGIPDEFNYLSINEAFKRNVIQVKELNEAGSVNSLLVLNSSADYIFLNDGDILEGAKQNRVLNTSVLLFPNSKVVIPVSCVESGRWRYSTTDFSPSEFFAPSELRLQKIKATHEALKERGVRDAQQGEVWKTVKEYHKKYKVDSETSNLTDLKERIDLSSFIKEYECNAEANGIAIFLENHILSLDIFHSRDVYKEYFHKIIQSAAIEIPVNKKTDAQLESAEAISLTKKLIAKAEKVNKSEFKGVGAGIEKRFSGSDFTGTSLEYLDYVIYYGLFKDKTKSTK